MLYVQIVLALALTPDTEGMISRSELAMMENHAWIVNVARGRHVVTEDLVWALDGLGIETGVDLEALVQTSVWMAGQLGRPSPSRVVKALAG